MRRKAFVAALTLLLAAGSGRLRAQQPDIDRQVEEAGRLYREASFSDAIIKLQGAVDLLTQLQSLEARKIQLVDAHLMLALSYFALDDRATAREHLKNVARLDPRRRLDPQVYAPPVLALFAEAQAEVAKEPPRATTRAAAPGKPKEGGSKTAIIIGGVAAVAGAGVAVAAAGGGSNPTPAPVTPSLPSATPPPTTTSGSSSITLLSAPPSGNTIRFAQSGTLFDVTASITYGTSGTYRLCTEAGQPPVCIGGCSPPLDLVAGQPLTAVGPFRYVGSDPGGTGTPCPALPFTTTTIRLHITGPTPSFNDVFTAAFPLTYTFVQ